MALSRPLYTLLGTYLEQLFNHPVRTKAISSCVIATAGNVASQYIAKGKIFDNKSLIAYAVFGLMFGGTIPHYFYEILERVVRDRSSFPIFKKIFIERLLYTPLYQAFTLYTIARLEGKSHKAAVKQMESLYWPVLSSSWKFISVVQIINLAVIPPMLRVLIMNLVGFFWVIFIANKRRQQEQKGKNK